MGDGNAMLVDMIGTIDTSTVKTTEERDAWEAAGKEKVATASAAMNEEHAGQDETTEDQERKNVLLSIVYAISLIARLINKNPNLNKIFKEQIERTVADQEIKNAFLEESSIIEPEILVNNKFGQLDMAELTRIRDEFLSLKNTLITLSRSASQ